jgi:hypothetical protein
MRKHPETNARSDSIKCQTGNSVNPNFTSFSLFLLRNPGESERKYRFKTQYFSIVFNPKSSIVQLYF